MIHKAAVILVVLNSSHCIQDAPLERKPLSNVYCGTVKD